MLAGYETNMFHHLETIRLSSSASSVTFTNLGQYSDFQHLQIRLIARSAAGGSNSYIRIRYNGDDTVSNYARHIMVGNGSSVNSYASTGTTLTNIGLIPASGYTASAFGAHIADILDPFETTKYTTLRSIGGLATIEVDFNSILWMNTAVLTSIKIEDAGGSTLVAGSRFALYGLKARV